MKVASTLLLGASAVCAAALSRRSDDITVVIGDDTTVGLGQGNDIAIVDGDNNDVNGGQGADNILVAGDNNDVSGGQGSDNVLVDGDNSTVNGGRGSDNVLVDGDNSTVNGGRGSDNILVDGDNNDVNGGVGADTVTVTGDNNIVDGGNGADQITVTGESNVVDAGNGDDNVLTGNNDDTISDGNGNDVVVSGAGDDTIINGAGNDKVNTGSGDDTVVDGAGRDHYQGGAGNDVFVDGRGNDVYRGQAGNDTYIFDLTQRHGRLNRVFHFQHGNTSRDQDELVLSSVNKSDVEITHTIVEKCITDISYVDPDTGKKRIVRVHSRFGCLEEDDITFTDHVNNPYVDYFTHIPRQACGHRNSNDWAYINNDNEFYDPNESYTPAANPLRWHRGDTLESTVETCSEICHKSDGCVAFNVLTSGLHSDGFGKEKDANSDVATCYFRSHISNVGNDVPTRECYRVIPDINLVSDLNPNFPCIEGINYDYTADFFRFKVWDNCQGTFTFGDEPHEVTANSTGETIQVYTYDMSTSNGF